MDPVRTFERVRDAILAVDVPGVRVEVELLSHGMWSQMPIDHPATQAAAQQPARGLRRRSLLPVRGRLDPGGRLVQRRMLGLPVVLLGFTNPDDQAHAPNENMVLANYEGGIRSIAPVLVGAARPAPLG